MIYFVLAYFRLHCQEVLIMYHSIFIQLHLKLMVAESSSYCKSASDTASHHVASSHLNPIYLGLEPSFMILTQVDSFAIATKDGSTVT